MNKQSLISEALSKYTYKDIANKLNVANGTVKRWIDLNKVPRSYEFDLMKICNITIDYSLYNSKDKDQFFTPPNTVKYCYNKVYEIINELGDDISTYNFIEPSAGDGAFLNVLPLSKTTALDIEPQSSTTNEHICKNIIKCDYLEWSPVNKEKNIVIGNPPFGLRGNMALRFINHSFDFADYVCFILPQLFESDGKGVPRKRVKGYNLIHSEKLDTHFYEPSKTEVKVNCIFQIWSKYKTNNKYEIKKQDNSIIKIYSLSDGGTPSTTRNKNMHYKCDIYIPSTCYGEDNMKYYNTFNELPRKKGYGIVFNKNREENLNKFRQIKWSDIAFLSTNSAYNIRTSQIMEHFM